MTNLRGLTQQMGMHDNINVPPAPENCPSQHFIFSLQEQCTKYIMCNTAPETLSTFSTHYMHMNFILFIAISLSLSTRVIVRVPETCTKTPESYTQIHKSPSYSTIIQHLLIGNNL